MNTLLVLNKQNPIPIGINLEVNPRFLHMNETCLTERLRAVTTSPADPELGKAWRNRMIIRSRLRKYTSG